MHDGAAARSYDDETYVVDPDDWNPREDLTVQIRDDDSIWHRKAIGGFTTACGDPILRGQELRHETYAGVLCRKGCFAHFELDKSDEKNREIDLADEAFVRRLTGKETDDADR